MANDCETEVDGPRLRVSRSSGPVGARALSDSESLELRLEPLADAEIDELTLFALRLLCDTGGATSSS